MSLPAGNSNIEYVLDSNEKFTPLAANSKVLIENIAQLVSYREESPQSTHTDQFTFSIDTSDNFVDRGVLLTFDKLRLKTTLNNGKNAAATVIDFHDNVFDGYKDLCLKQFGMMNAINRIDVKIDNQLFSSNDVSETFNLVSPYYDKAQVHKYFDASLPDYLYDNRLHQAGVYVPTLNANNDKIMFKNAVSTLDINSPYSSVSNSEYNTRIPVFTLDTAVAAADITKPINVTLHGMSCWLPFNILGILGETTPLYNVGTIQITIILHKDWPSRIFSTVPGANGNAKYTFDFNRTTEGAVSSKIFVRLYTPPEQIRSALDEKKPYLFEYPHIVLDSRKSDVVFDAGKHELNINTAIFDMPSIPQKIYVGVTPKLEAVNEHLINNNHFCRWNNLRVELLGQPTEIVSGNNSEYLYNLCKENGLSLNKQTALYTLGFPLCLDVSNNLACKSNNHIGLNLSGSSGKYTFRISGNISRLHTDFVTNAVTDTEANLWKYNKKVYEMKCAFVYKSFCTYNIAGKKFDDVQSLSADNFNSARGDIQSLYENFVPRVNIVGGSIFSSLMPHIKNGISKGINIAKAIISNKNGIRDKILEASKGSGAQSNIIGGVFDSHAPILGANASNWKDYSFD